MKETLAEYARIIIVVIAFAMVCIFLLGGTWFGRMGSTLFGIENDIAENRQQTVLDLLEEREKPKLIVEGKTYKTGEQIKLKTLIKSATTKGEDNTSLVNIADRVEVRCDSKYFNEETQILTPEVSGIYTVKYSVKDDYGFTTTILVKLVVND